MREMFEWGARARNSQLTSATPFNFFPRLLLLLSIIIIVVVVVAAISVAIIFYV